MTIRTHEACIRIIDKKKGRSITRLTATTAFSTWWRSLLFGRLTAADYEDNVAQDKRIDALREINCFEDPVFTADYHDPENAPSPMP